jgi:hypothetical protein
LKFDEVVAAKAKLAFLVESGKRQPLKEMVRELSAPPRASFKTGAQTSGRPRFVDVITTNFQKGIRVNNRHPETFCCIRASIKRTDTSAIK